MKRFTPTENNVEISSLVWLDSSVNTLQESIDAQQRLRSLMDHLEAFEHEDDCEQYIKSLSESEPIVLIASGKLGQKIVRRVHQLRQVASIYIYCGDKDRHKVWIKEFPKVSVRCNREESLFSFYYLRIDRN